MSVDFILAAMTKESEPDADDIEGDMSAADNIQADVVTNNEDDTCCPHLIKELLKWPPVLTKLSMGIKSLQE